MGLSEMEESCLQLDEKLLRFMDQLELLEEKRATLNSLIEQVPPEMTGCCLGWYPLQVEYGLTSVQNVLYVKRMNWS